METFKELLVPSNFCLFLAVAGAATYLVPATRRLSCRLFAAAALLLLVLSSGWTASALLSPLEHAYGPARAPAEDPQPLAIVVLAAWGADDPDMPLSSWPNGSAIFRIVEAVHLRSRCTACPVFVTGSSPTVDVMAEVLASLGVARDAIVLDRDAQNTAQSARNVAARFGAVPFYLVTSAGHMPRALLAFRAHGLDPLPAPTDYQLPREFSRANLLPSPMSLYLSDLAVHEYLGILWYRLKRVP